MVSKVAKFIMLFWLHVNYTFKKICNLLSWKNIFIIFWQIGLISKNISCVNEAMTQAGHLIESFSGSPLHKEYLKVFFLVLQVCHYLMAGQVSFLILSILFSVL